MPFPFGQHYVLRSLGGNMNENVEIERRFLIDGRKEKPWRDGKHFEIKQYYLSEVTHNNGVVAWRGLTLVEDQRDFTEITTWRIRSLVNETGFKAVLTAKGKRIGATAIEYEWELPSESFGKLDLSDLPTVIKTRYHCDGDDGLLWEVDEFEGCLSGLIIAEVELEKEDQNVLIPDWVGLELTHLKGWSNAALAEMIGQQ